VFGCIGHIHIPNNKKQKLDDKSFKCVLLSLSEESKAYRFYDLVSKKVVIYRDIVFEEDEKWNWGKIVEETNHDFLEWGDEDELDEKENEDASKKEEQVKERTTSLSSNESAEDNSLNPFSREDKTITIIDGGLCKWWESVSGGRE